MASLSPLMEEILQQGGAVELTVTGDSMWPMLLYKVSRICLTLIETLRRGGTASLPPAQRRVHPLSHRGCAERNLYLLHR